MEINQFLSKFDLFKKYYPFFFDLFLYIETISGHFYNFKDIYYILKKYF